MTDDQGQLTGFVVYTYPGAGTIIHAAHPAVSGGLTLTYGSNGDYAGRDRFGRPPKGEMQNVPLPARLEPTKGGKTWVASPGFEPWDLANRLGDSGYEYESLCCKPPLTDRMKARFMSLGAEF